MAHALDTFFRRIMTRNFNLEKVMVVVSLEDIFYGHFTLHFSLNYLHQTFIILDLYNQVEYFTKNNQISKHFSTNAYLWNPYHSSFLGLHALSVMLFKYFLYCLDRIYFSLRVKSCHLGLHLNHTCVSFYTLFGYPFSSSQNHFLFFELFIYFVKLIDLLLFLFFLYIKTTLESFRFFLVIQSFIFLSLALKLFRLVHRKLRKYLFCFFVIDDFLYFLSHIERAS